MIKVKIEAVKNTNNVMLYEALLAVVCPNCGSKRIEVFINGTPRNWWIDGVCIDCDCQFNSGKRIIFSKLENFYYLLPIKNYRKKLNKKNSNLFYNN